MSYSPAAQPDWPALSAGQGEDTPTDSTGAPIHVGDLVNAVYVDQPVTGRVGVIYLTAASVTHFGARVQIMVENLDGYPERHLRYKSEQLTLADDRN